MSSNQAPVPIGRLTGHEPESLLSTRERKQLALLWPMLPPEGRTRLTRWRLRRAKALSPNSVRALLSDWRHFACWATDGSDLVYLTYANPDDLIDYFEANLHLAKATLDRRHSSLTRLFEVLGHPDNPARDEDVLAHLKEIRREQRHGAGRGQAAPLRWQDIETIINALDPECEPRDQRARLALGLMYDGMLRRSELANLRVADIEPEDPKQSTVLGEGNALIVVRRSKTDQEGNQRKLHCAQLTARWAQAWIDGFSLSPEHYLICPLNTDGDPVPSTKRGINTNEVSDLLKRAARQAGFAPEVVAQISGHSPRVGKTQDMLADGKGIFEVMHDGRWRSVKMVLRYAEGLAAKYGASASLSRNQGRTPDLDEQGNGT